MPFLPSAIPLAAPKLTMQVTIPFLLGIGVKSLFLKTPSLTFQPESVPPVITVIFVLHDIYHNLQLDIY